MEFTPTPAQAKAIKTFLETLGTKDEPKKLPKVLQNPELLYHLVEDECGADGLKRAKVVTKIFKHIQAIEIEFTKKTCEGFLKICAKAAAKKAAKKAKPSAKKKKAPVKKSVANGQNAD